jgi:uncharacterized radical SAM protein YgiQ
MRKISGKPKGNFPRAEDVSRKFLPISRRDMELRGWRELDFLCVSGDAYVDHPSFGPAIVSRLLENLGYKIGVIPQPDWRGTADFTAMGRPRLGVLVSAGNLDSMLSNYSSPGKRRAKDDYSPCGAPRRRPDRATIVYCNRIREIWGEIPLIIGGIEASLRRIAHYDYWSGEVRRSILADSRADLLIYGMAEFQLERVASLLSSGVAVRDIRDVPGVCWKTHDVSLAGDPLVLPSFEAVRSDKRAFAEAFRIWYSEQNFADGRVISQDQNSWTVVNNPPPPPLSVEAMDKIYSLPYTRCPHPIYRGEEIPAFAEVQFSITSHRGCFGECAFCAITAHQGRVIQSRSRRSIIREAEILTKLPDFKGYIHDVGGPTANFRVPSCRRSVSHGPCRGKSCIYPEPCARLEFGNSEYMQLLRDVAALPGVKKVFVRSGLRIDYILADPEGEKFLEELCLEHISGQLKIAPEHTAPEVLKFMRKSPHRSTVKFMKLFAEINARIGKNQFIVPYFMSSHPGAGLNEAIALAEFMRDAGVKPEQVQEFTPTPGTLATCMYYSGIDPFSGCGVHVARDSEERAMQRALLQYWQPRNRKLVLEALCRAGRMDLAGPSKRSLVSSSNHRQERRKTSLSCCEKRF